MPSLRSGALDRRLCSFPFWQRRLWRTCQLLSLRYRGHSFFSAGPVCSSISAEACAILHSLCWSRQHQQVCLFSFLLNLADSCHPVLSFISPFTSISVRNCFLSSPVPSGYNGSPDIRFFQTTTRLMS